MKLCEYGCGQEAKHQFKNSKWCCSDDYRKCQAFIEKIRQKNIGKKRNRKTKNNISQGRKGKKNKLPEILSANVNILCSFGCNKKALYYFSTTNRYSCSDHHSKCTGERKRRSKRNIGKKLSSETKRKISKKIIQLNKESEEYRFKQSTSRKLIIDQINERYPTFSIIEEMRYNPGKPGEKEIQVHCKNHSCPNSKKQGGWFTPIRTQLAERIRQIESEYGQGGCYFYCSDHCKQECPLYNLYSDPLKDNDKPYTFSEYSTFRNYVLERDRYICQYCGDPATDVHHERPQKLEPFFALDPDLAWSCCKTCHNYYGHKKGTECSTGQLATKIC